uniref:Ovule protein n=1 Tax=Ascaris lumbricoides TaxID=6252 RepID=A0A0M3HXA1_ASCLU
MVNKYTDNELAFKIILPKLLLRWIFTHLHSVSEYQLVNCCSIDFCMRVCCYMTEFAKSQQHMCGAA